MKIIIGSGLVAAASLLLLRALKEPYDLDVSHSKLGLTRAGPDMPKNGVAEDTMSGAVVGSGTKPQLKVLLLTDLHAEHLRISPARLRDELLIADVDCVLFGGDLTGRYHLPERALPWLTVMREVLTLRHLPAFAVVGNHDSAHSLALLTQYGFTLLRNQHANVTDRTGYLWQVLGLDIIKKGYPDFGAARLSPVDSSATITSIPEDRRIVLAHNPDTILQIPSGQARFFLAGHFHGGQIYMPFHLEFLLLRREKMGRLGFRKGPFIFHGLNGYISRGLGSVLFPLRLGSKPEIAILELN
ncbi:MAG: metallophosphoesterase [Eubacteriales bacterium]|nr:metallophosphoesterase [Eubacteriales bacterium]